jgi:PBP1b-binding outer membrane lipoprotein LpoB
MKYLILALFLAGCSAPNHTKSEDKSTRKLSTTVSGTYRVYTDPETKCEYLMYHNFSGSSSITPRIGSDGKIIC